MVPGAGMDCIAVPAWVYLKTGLLKEFNPPAYTLDGGRHRDLSQVLAWLRASPLFFEVARATPCAPGDALCFRQSRSAHHVGLMITEHEFIHAAERYGVIKSSLEDPVYRRALVAIFRPVILP